MRKNTYQSTLILWKSFELRKEFEVVKKLEVAEALRIYKNNLKVIRDHSGASNKHMR